MLGMRLSLLMMALMKRLGLTETLFQVSIVDFVIILAGITLDLIF